VLDVGEQCDDGNVAPGDSCDRFCRTVHPADATLPATVVELPFSPNCQSDRDCRAGKFCIAGRCMDCRNDADCRPGELCLSYQCVQARVVSCTDNNCTANGEMRCRSDLDCPAGSRCVGDRCVFLSMGPGGSNSGPLTDTGPETLAIMAAGAAAGLAWMRRRPLKS
jgi:cysteine-rich repeat protein